MSVLYDLFKNPNPNKTDKTQTLHPRIVPKGTITSDEFLDRVHKFTGISRSLLCGSMESFCLELRDLLADGWNVEFGELGYFSGSLQSPPVNTKNKIRAGSIQLKNINFRTSRRFRKEVADKMTFERAASPSHTNKSDMTEAESLSLLYSYLNKYPCINRTQYCKLTGRNKHAALDELNGFIKQGKLIRHGMGKQVVYAKNTSPLTHDPS